MKGIRQTSLRINARQVAAALVVAVVCASTGRAADRAGEQVWLISTRHLPMCRAAQGSVPLDYLVLTPGNEWVAAEESAFLAHQSPDVPTCVFIPGNRADWNAAIRSGWQAYQQIKTMAPDEPLRFVIWSWPADRISNRTRPDVREKAARCDSQCIYLAQWLDRLSPDVPVCLIGYSFGARILTGAMHLCGGGVIQGRSLPWTAPRRAPVRAVLVAAALDYDWLLPGHCHGLALGQIEQMLITVNRCDPPLKYYAMLYGPHGVPALGYKGLPCCAGAADALAHVEEIDITAEVDKTHEWVCYLAAPSLASRLPWYAFLDVSTSRNGRWPR